MVIFRIYMLVSCPPILLMVGGEGLKVFGARCRCAGAGGGGSLLLSGQLQSSGDPGLTVGIKGEAMETMG